MDELTTAAATGNTEAVKALLQKIDDVNGLNCFGRTPLQVGGPVYAPCVLGLCVLVMCLLGGVGCCGVLVTVCSVITVL